MDPNTARAVLRLPPGVRPTPQQIDDAFRAELWARHPARYPDPAGRAEAEAWGSTLASARVALIAESEGRGGPGASAGTGRRRPSRGVVIGIVAGAVAFALLLVAVGLGAARVAEVISERMLAQSEAAVERWQSGETLFTFPAAIEWYGDDRMADQCPDKYLNGCWQSALFTEADCDALMVTVAFARDEGAVEPDWTRREFLHDVVGYEPTPLIYGDDEAGWSWIDDVQCLDTPA
ncbi:hypothetical protein [Agromyces sp. LHK192]|uniref:hypothetical protein n=1 Tax=Agromyces sp. LHK192 TaxID=2498704 RepID=UPI000FD826E6|nr:hypothetical protein [Agromyces sp. LHK192]